MRTYYLDAVYIFSKKDVQFIDIIIWSILIQMRFIYFQLQQKSDKAKLAYETAGNFPYVNFC